VEKNIEKYVFVKQNFLDNEFCQHIIKDLNQLNAWKKHEWTTYDPKQEQIFVSNSPSGKNEPEIIPPEIQLEDINDFLGQKILKVAAEYIDSLKFEWFDAPFYSLSYLKYIKYSLNQTMKVHCDHIHDVFDGKNRGIPILTVIGILNDDYEGGNLVMFEDKKINTKEGDLIIFPSLFLFPHEIESITKGIRYSYTAWMW
jgi:hypothetical protein